MGSYELSEFLHTPPARYSEAVDILRARVGEPFTEWVTPEVTQADFAIPNPYKARVTRSKTGREPRNWKVVSDFWRLELVYGSWQAAMDAARVLADTGRVPAFYLLGAQPVGTPF